MAAQAGEQARKTSTFKCQGCNAEVRVLKSRTIPQCPNGHSSFDERVQEPAREKPLRGHPRRRTTRSARSGASRTGRRNRRASPGTRSSGSHARRSRRSSSGSRSTRRRSRNR